MVLSSTTLLVSIWFECLLYGITQVAFALSAYLLLLHGRSGETPIWPVLTSLSATSLVGSIHLVLSLAGAIHGLKTLSQSTDTTTPHYRAGMLALYTTANAIADACVIWRLWVMCQWQRRTRAVVAPTVFLTAATACGFSAAAHSASYGWTAAFIAAALVVHVTTIGMSSWCFFWPLKSQIGMRTVCLMLAVNSGGIYAVLLLVLLVLHVCDAAASVVLRDVMVHVTLLLPALAIIHTALFRRQPESPTEPSLADFPRRSDTPESFRGPAGGLQILELPVSTFGAVQDSRMPECTACPAPIFLGSKGRVRNAA